MTLEQFAELYSAMTVPMPEYAELSIVKQFEQQPEIVAIHEKYLLPEIIRLICCSQTLLEQPWAQRYLHVASLYKNNFNPEHILNNYPSPDDVELFDQEILALSNKKILEVFQKFFSDLDTRKKSLSSQKGILTKKLKAQMTSDENTSNPVTIADLEQKMLDLNNQTAQIKSALNRWSSHRLKIESALNKFNEIDEEFRRKKMYSDLFSNSIDLQNEHLNELAEEFLKTDTLPQELRNLLSDEQLQLNTLKKIAESACIEDITTFVMKLYEQGAIDLESPSISSFILQHRDETAAYLYRHLNKLISDCEPSDDDILLKMIISSEIQNILIGNPLTFQILWAEIDDESIWAYIFQTICEEYIDQRAFIFSSFVNALPDQIYPYVFSWISLPDTDRYGVSVDELMYHLISNKCTSEFLKFLLNQKLISLQETERKLRVAERKERRQASKLFTAVYQPLERLEELTSSLKSSTGQVSCELIAHQLLGIVTAFREGFSSMNLHSLYPVDQWNIKSIPYDSQKQQLIEQITIPIELVTLQTLGFQYINEFGEETIYLAKVAEKKKKKIESIPQSSFPRKQKKQLRTKQSKAINEIKPKKKKKRNGGNHK